MTRLSEHDEFMAGEARDMDRARRMMARRGYPVQPLPMGWPVRKPVQPAPQLAKPKGGAR